MPNSLLVRRPCGMRTVLVSPPETIESTSMSNGAASNTRARPRPSPPCSRSMDSVNGAPGFLSKTRLVSGPLRPSNSPSGSSRNAFPCNSSLSNASSLLKRPAGRVVNCILFRSSVSNASSPLKRPAGRVANWLLFRCSNLNAPSPLKRPAGTDCKLLLLPIRSSSNAVSPAKTFSGSVVKSLLCRISLSNAVSPLKRSSGSVVRLLLCRSSLSNAVSPAKSPLRGGPLNVPCKRLSRKSSSVTRPKWAMVT